MIFTPAFLLLATSIATIVLAFGLPPIPAIRPQYRASVRIRHHLRRNLVLPGRMALWTLALTLAIAGAGAAIAYAMTPSSIPARQSSSPHESGDLDDLVTYARAIGNDAPKPEAQNLPDVETMIDRLKTRLENTPDDVRGWRMLGWSYFNTGAYARSAEAYAKAAELDPNSDEIKRLLASAREKASEASTQRSAETR